MQGALQPIANAKVHIYAVDPQNTAASQNIELVPAIRSDSHGAFHFPAIACPTADSLIYVRTRGGVPAVTGNANHAITLLNMLGTCSSLAAETSATVNELTTVGAAWPLAAFTTGRNQFKLAGGQAAQFSAAVALVGKLVNSDLGTTPGRLLTATETAPVTEINSLANAISACIVTNGGVAGDGSACGKLFSLAGYNSDKVPTDTLAAALLLAQNPSRNVTGVYALATSRAIFTPSLTSAPADWTMATKSADTLPGLTLAASGPPSAPADDTSAAAVAVGTDSPAHAVAHAKSQATPPVANTIVIKTGGTYSGDWVSTDPAVVAVSIQTDQPVTIQNSTVTGPGNLIAVTGSSGANLTLLNVTGTAVDPMVAGKARGAFLVAYTMNSLSVTNCTITGTMFGIKVGFSTATSLTISNNQGINLEDRLSDGNGGFQATRTQPGKFIYLYQVVAPNGADIGWNQLVQTMGQSSVDSAVEIYKSQGTSTTPILVHDNYLEGMSSPAVTTYSGSALAATGDNTTLESDFINFVSNEVVHTAGSGLTISNGHDISAQTNRVVSCGQDAGAWDTKAGVYGIILWNRSNGPSFFNNTITTTAGGLVVPNSSGNPVAADSSANPVDLQTASNSVSGNLFTDPCLVGGALTLSAEDTERAFWANKLSTNNETIGDQHGPVGVSVSPASSTLNPSQTQQFSSVITGASNTAVTWTISPAVGTISTTGLYTAPASVTTQQTLTVTATSVQDSTKAASNTITLNPPVSATLTPGTVALLPSATQQFTATVVNNPNTSVTWSMSPSAGTLSASGLYTAPSTIATQQTVTVTATSVADTTKTTTAIITLNPPTSVTITPATLTAYASQTQQFTATAANAANNTVTWSMSPATGTLSASGLYTAPASITTQSTVTITATSVQDTTKTATSVLTVSPAISVAVSPASAALVLSQVQQLTATVTYAADTSVTWSISPAVGSISATGVYTAPSTLASLTTITATATSNADSTKTGTATLTVNPSPVTVSPNAVSLYATQTQQFTTQVQGTSNQSITWSMTPAVGTLSTAGLYTAPSSITGQQNVTITAYSPGVGTYSNVRVTLLPPVKVGISSSNYFSDTVNATNQLSAQVQFTTNTAVTWSLSPAVGTVSASGLYTAPATITAQQTITFTATSVADPTKSAGGTIVLSPPVKVAMAVTAATLLPGATQQLTAYVSWSSNTTVTWSMSPSLGTLSSAGLYTAPSNTTSVQTVVVTATSVADTTKSATATITLNPPVGVSITPASATVTLGQIQQYAATIQNSTNTSVTWSISPAVGSISTAGRYTPPTTAVTSPQTVTVTAVSAADTTKSGTATVTINPPVAIAVSPTTTSLYASQAQQFTPSVQWSSNQGATYTLSPAVGSISATGVYTAPSSITSQQGVSVTIASVADPSKYVLASITLLPPVVIRLYSSYFANTANQTSQLSAQVLNTTNTAVTWSISPAVGTVSASGLYTAPSTITAQQIITFTATSVAEPSQSASGSVTLNPSVSVAVVPAAVTLTRSHTTQFVANVSWSSNTAVTWTQSAGSAGTLTSSGLYTAPDTINSNSVLTVTATSAADPTQSATATINLLTLVGPAPIVITEGGTYSGNWISNDPTVPTVTINTDAPVTILNSTAQGRGTLILVNGINGANVTVQNVTGTGLDPQVAGLQRGSFITAFTMQSLTVQNNTMSGVSFGVKLGTSPALTALSIMNNVGSQLEDRPSDGAGGLLTTRPQFGHFVALYQVIAPNGGEIGWNQLIQTSGQSSTEDGINIYNSQGASGAPLLVHDNYLEGYSSTTTGTYTGNGLITDGDASGVTSYVVFQANEMVHTAGGGVALASGHDTSANANRVVSCGQDSLGNWYSRLGASAAAVWNYYGSNNFNNNFMTTTAGGLVAPDANGMPTISDGGIVGPVGNSTSDGNLYTDPCFVNGSLNLAAEDAERAFWANKLSTNNEAMGDQHSPIAVTVGPATSTLNPSQIQQVSVVVTGASNTAVTWTVSPSVGTVNATGLYTAPTSVTTQQTVNVTATSVQDGTKSASTIITLNPPVGVSLTPSTVALLPSATQQFTATVMNNANTSVTWSMSPSVGTLSTAGLYTAPSTITAQQTVTVTATSVADSTMTNTATITLTPPVSIAVTPTTLTAYASQTQQFTATTTNAANTAVSWSMSPATGTLSATGLYTAPASITTQSTVTITATSVQDTTKTATAVLVISPPVSVSVSPASVALVLSQVQQFTATVTYAADTSVIWSISPAVGSISTSGVYTAPSALAALTTVTATATSNADSTKTASATFTVNPTPVTVTPNPVSLYASQTQQFTAQVQDTTNQSITWSMSPSLGTLSAVGLYMAPSSITSQQNVTITAYSPAVGTYVNVRVTLLPPVKVGISSSNYFSDTVNATNQLSAQVQNTTNTAVTWSLSPAVGTVSATGLYTAPATITAQQTITFTATSVADTTKSASGSIVLSPPVKVVMAVPAATLLPGATQQFTANVSWSSNIAVTWTMSPSLGTLSSAGLYTAPSDTTSVQTVVITATSVADPTKSATATVTLNPPVSVSVTPTAATVTLGQTQLYTANVLNTSNTNVTWSINPAVGSISTAGRYTPPSTAVTSPQTVTVTATSVVDTTQSASAVVTVNPPVSITVTPTTSSLYASQTQQFTPDVEWSSYKTATYSISPAVGSISSTGLYTAPSSITSQQGVSVTITSVADPSKYVMASITLLPPVKVGISSSNYFADTVNATNQLSAQVQNTTNTAVTWSLSPAVGSVSSTGLYTAPATITAQQTITFTATSVADPTRSASGSIVLSPPVKVVMAVPAATLLPGATQQLTAYVSWSSNTAVTWSMSPSLGTLSSSGLYTAPSNTTTVQTVIVTATSVADTTKSAIATITLNPPVNVSVTPATSTITLGQTQLYTATVQNTSNANVTWTISPATGTISTGGRYTPPSTAVTSPQTVTVTATSVVDTTQSASATVTINPPVAITVTPTTTSLYASQTQQFTPTVQWNSNQAATYTLSSAVGSISATGLYTAPSSITSQQGVTVTISSAADSSKYVLASITLLPPVRVNISSVSYFADTVNQTNQLAAQVLYAANTAVTWSLSPAVGTVSTSGLYTSPATITSQQTITFTATSVADSTKSASGTIVLSPPVKVAMAVTSATLQPGATQQLTAYVSWSNNTAVTWSMSPSLGTLSSAGLYTAPSDTTSVQTVVVTATSVADPTKSATATITLNPAS